MNKPSVKQQIERYCRELRLSTIRECYEAEAHKAEQEQSSFGLYPDLSTEQSGVTYCFDITYADTVLNRINVYIGHNILMRKPKL